MSKTLFKKITTLSMCALLSFSSILPSVQATAAFAEETSAVGTIEADLEAMSFNTAEQNAKTEIEVISVQEHYYSEDSAKAKDYSLYIYIYTPAKTALQTAEGVNTVNMAIAYDDYNTPINYQNIALSYVDCDNDYRYYKFKVASSDSKQLYDMAKKYSSRNNGKRRYDIAGVQLKKATGDSYTDEITKANDIQYGKTYYFTGYETGYGVEGSAPLSGTYDNLETIALSVNDTYWRGGNQFSTADMEYTYYGDQLNTVYFSVPQKYFDEYGGTLQKIKAEWWEYKTNPIFVTSDQGAYNALKGKVGDYIDVKDETLDYRVLWEKTYVKNSISETSSFTVFDKVYNKLPQKAVLYNEYATDIQYVPQLDVLIYDENAKDHHDVVSGDKLKEQIDEYSKAHALSNKVTVGRGESKSAMCFADSIDEDRQYLLEESKVYGEDGNYIQVEIDADEDTQNILTANQSWWDKAWGVPNVASESVSPIVQVDDSILSLSIDSFAEKYYINDEDKDEVFAYCREQLQAGNVPILFRHAKTKYYGSTACFHYYKSSELWENGYVAQETLFYNLDIISLSFKSGWGKLTVIPAVADPSDIYTDLGSPNDPNGGNTDKPSNGIFGGSNGANTVTSIFGTVFNLISVLFLLVVIGLIIYGASKLFRGEGASANAQQGANGNNAKVNAASQTGTATPQKASAKNAKSKTTTLYLFSSIKSNYKNKSIKSNIKSEGSTNIKSENSKKNSRKK